MPGWRTSKRSEAPPTARPPPRWRTWRQRERRSGRWGPCRPVCAATTRSRAWWQRRTMPPDRGHGGRRSRVPQRPPAGSRSPPTVRRAPVGRVRTGPRTASAPPGRRSSGRPPPSPAARVAQVDRRHGALRVCSGMRAGGPRSPPPAPPTAGWWQRRVRRRGPSGRASPPAPPRPATAAAVHPWPNRREERRPQAVMEGRRGAGTTRSGPCAPSPRTYPTDSLQVVLGRWPPLPACAHLTR